MLYDLAVRICLSVALLLPSLSASARLTDSLPRPLVLIPGILGSTLVNASGEVVWRDAQSLNRFEELEYSPSPAGNDLRSTDIMRKDFLLGPWKSGSYGPALEILSDLGFEEGENLFIFHYDWRKSNFDVARDFEGFVERHLANRDFNILAHSMGGIVALIFTQGQVRARSVNRIVTAGTPYLGSLMALDVLINGPAGAYKFLRTLPMLPYDEYSVARVFLSFPSFFELLPSYDDCCFLEVSQYADRQVLSMLSAEQLLGLPVMPADFLDRRLRRRVDEALASRAKIDKLVKHFPDGIEWFHIGGDTLETPYQIRVTGYAANFRMESLWAGDGTVLWKSAVPHEGGIVLPTKRLHHQILEDPGVVKWIEHLLVAEAPMEDELDSEEREDAGNEETTNVYSQVYKRYVKLGGAGLSIGEPYKASGEIVDVIVSLVDADRRPIPGVHLTGAVSEQDGDFRADLSFEPMADSYHSSFRVPHRAGIYSVAVSLDEQTVLEDFFLAYESSDAAELLVARGELEAAEALEALRQAKAQQDQLPGQQEQVAVAEGGAQQEQQPQATAESPLAAMPASDLIGTDVKNQEGETVADIVELVKEQGSEEIYAVLSVGGFLGIGDKRVMVPLDELQVDQEGEVVMANASEEQLRDMPEFNQEGFESLSNP